MISESNSPLKEKIKYIRNDYNINNKNYFNDYSGNYNEKYNRIKIAREHNIIKIKMQKMILIIIIIINIVINIVIIIMNLMKIKIILLFVTYIL